MRHSIVEKIDVFVRQEALTTEAGVTYFLVEARKIIIDHDRQRRNYRTLSFFCDWVVHAKLDRSHARNMLDEAQNFYRGLDVYLHIKKQTNFSPFIWLIVLRQELKVFCGRNNLPSAWLTDPTKWENFLFALLDVIIDAPLLAPSGHIRRLQFLTYSQRNNITCELELADGSTQRFNTKSRAELLESL